MERVPSVSHDCTLYSIVMTDTGDDMILFLTFQNFQRQRFAVAQAAFLFP